MRFGVLGTGHWATVTQAAALSTHPSATLAGVWGRSPDKTADLASRYGVPGYDDVDALFADVDAVAIALPPDVQAPLAVRAAGAGRHLLLEKPIAFTVADADRVAAAVTAAGVASVVFFTWRFQQTTATWLDQAARTTLAGGAGSWLSSLAGSPFDDSPWRKRYGAMWDIGPHLLSV